MRKIISLLAVCCLARQSHAQWAVSDATSQTLIELQTAMDMEKWAEQLARMNDMLTQSRRVIELTGDPVQAAGALGAVAGVDPVAKSGATSSLASMLKTANAAQSLYWTGNGLYQSLPDTLPDGGKITRDLNAYKSIAAFESAYDRYLIGAERLQSARVRLLRDIETLQAQPVTTESQQREKQIKLAALQAQLAALEQERARLSEEVAVQKAANDEQRAKQEQARKENNHAERQNFWQRQQR
ncbi:MAG: hypothetical protein LBD30_00740 [Verrucomicrobiales bacterium]|jgi:hypothetical protein|nr:hypothetical protein [Verrucomicrobiales bacterium]